MNGLDLMLLYSFTVFASLAPATIGEPDDAGTISTHRCLVSRSELCESLFEIQGRVIFIT